MNMLRFPRWCDIPPLSEKDIGVIAASDIPAGSKFGPSHDIPNILIKAKEDRKMSYALKVMIVVCQLLLTCIISGESYVYYHYLKLFSFT